MVPPRPLETFSTPPQSVTLAEATLGETIYYTTNGTAPTARIHPYTGPFRSKSETHPSAQTGHHHLFIVGLAFSEFCNRSICWRTSRARSI
jgi:hypothetical protein